MTTNQGKPEEKPAIKIPTMLNVSSSSISQVGYDDGALFVRFVKGKLYRYPGVTPDEYAELRKSESIGRHLQLNIMTKSTGALVPESEE